MINLVYTMNKFNTSKTFAVNVSANNSLMNNLINVCKFTSVVDYEI